VRTNHLLEILYFGTLGLMLLRCVLPLIALEVAEFHRNRIPSI